ncbi:MAG: PAS domain S-box protein [Myxococcota bacterium]|jgi:PAS domain S-box-containing protein|nr:PAS domain S-box protein [Myxococcota bacterium]
MSDVLASGKPGDAVGPGAAAPPTPDEALLRQVRSGRLLAGILMRFAQDPLTEVDANIELALAEVGQHLGAEHAYLILVDQLTRHWSMTHEWASAVSGVRKQHYVDRPSSMLPWIIGTLRRGEVVRLQSLDDFPADAQLDRRVHEEIGHQAMLITPVQGKGGVATGALGFDVYSGPHVWADEEVELVRTLGSVVASMVERQQAEVALRESRERLGAILNLSPDIVSILDGQGTLVYNSPAAQRIHGYLPEDLQGKSTFDLIHPEDQPLVSARLAELVARSEGLVQVGYRYRDKDGSWRWMDAVASNQLGNPVLQGIVCISRDVSERKRQEQERQAFEQHLRQVQKLESLGVLAGGIAHDFNNLLMAILGNLDLALADTSPLSPVRTNLLAAETASRRAAELSRQMLAYSGRGRFVVEPTDLNAVIREIAGMLAVSISKKAELRICCAAALPLIQADPSQLRQVVMNLIFNASDALGEQSGVIDITTSLRQCDRATLARTYLDEQLPEGPYVCLEVTDTGCGMDPETLARVFDPFFTTKFTGRGLGLAVVLGIVRGHRGALQVGSSPGQGTRFQVLLPVPAQEAGQPEQVPTVSSSWRGGGTVLLVDDEEMVRAIGEQMLVRLGFSVVTAPDGRAALELIRKDIQRPAAERFVCVLLDLTMPRLDGEETLRAVRQLTTDLPVVLSSGYSEQEVRRRFGGLSLAGFVQKPYLLESLRTVLREAIEAAGPGAGPGEAAS